MISRELYWEIAKENGFFTWASFKPSSIDDIKSLILNGSNEIQVWKVDGGIISFINIHELAHKCKEWALSRGYEIKTHISYNLTDKVKGYWELCHERTSKPIKNMMFETCDSEPEAIFKACQWILDNEN